MEVEEYLHSKLEIDTWKVTFNKERTHDRDIRWKKTNGTNQISRAYLITRWFKHARYQSKTKHSNWNTKDDNKDN